VRTWIGNGGYLVKAAQTSVILLALQIPIYYGSVLHPGLYPRVRVTDEKVSTCGLLLLETEHDIRIWKADGGFGRILVYPRSDNGYSLLQQDDYVDVFQAAKSAQGGASEPNCK